MSDWVNLGQTIFGQNLFKAYIVLENFHIFRKIEGLIFTTNYGDLALEMWVDSGTKDFAKMFTSSWTIGKLMSWPWIPNLFSIQQEDNIP